LIEPVVLIPVKSAGIKSRLAPILSDSQRREFALLLLADVLGAFRTAGLLGRCRVVSSDAMALKVAAGLGVSGIREKRDRGVNAAVRFGVRNSGNPDEVLVVPSDIPLLRGSDIMELLTLRRAGMDVVLAPSQSFDGTNALLFSSSSLLPLSYDNNSFWNHLKGAAKLGLSTAVSSERSLMFDVDSPTDFKVLARSRSRGGAARFARRVLG